MRILSIDGGGYLGLASAAFIRGIERHFRISFHDRFDLFCGTSTGAIIALALASGRSGDDVVHLYKTLGKQVFGRPSLLDRLTRVKGFFRARHPNTALRECLEQEFGSTTLDTVWDQKKAVLVTAFSVTAGQPRVFKTNHSANLSTDGNLRLSDVAMASSAAPTFFPLARVGSPETGVETFCDGGVVANHPVLLGFAEALSELKINPAELHILSISTPRMDLSEGANKSRTMDRGLWGWRKSLSSILIDSHSTMAHQILARVISSYPAPKPLYERIEMSNVTGLQIDRADDQATETLESIGLRTAASNQVRPKVGRVLGCTEDNNG